MTQKEFENPDSRNQTYQKDKMTGHIKLITWGKRESGQDTMRSRTFKIKQKKGKKNI